MITRGMATIVLNGFGVVIEFLWKERGFCLAREKLSGY